MYIQTTAINYFVNKVLNIQTDMVQTKLLCISCSLWILFLIIGSMTPQQKLLHEKTHVNDDEHSTGSQSITVRRQEEIMWRYVIYFGLLHVASLYGLYLFFFEAKWLTCAFQMFLAYAGGLGITAGAHRLWAHRSYKARLPLRIILLYLYIMSLQHSVIDWVLDHRMHHKYTETNADPHNANRGFFFAHVGWLMVKRHPEFDSKVLTIDMKDLIADPLLRFEKRYYLIIAPIACFIIPTYIPTLWGESVWNALFLCGITRYVCCLNITWLVNSAAHLWGQNKPYDKRIMSVETKTISALALGEGFHNYHHTFPWDYKTAELGDYTLNLTTMFIDVMAKIGWAYDLKSVPRDVVHKRVQRTGDHNNEREHCNSY